MVKLQQASMPFNTAEDVVQEQW